VTVSACEPLASWPKQAEFPARGAASPMDGFCGGEGPTPKKVRGRMADNEWYDASRILDETVNIHMAHISQPGLHRTPRYARRQGDSPGPLERATADLGAGALPVGEVPFVRWEYAIYLATQVKNSDVYIMDKVSHHGEEEWPANYAGIVQGFLAREAFGLGIGIPSTLCRAYPGLPQALVWTCRSGVPLRAPPRNPHSDRGQ
jgi:hypothetical protein